jgi:hypothetical protein
MAVARRSFRLSFSAKDRDSNRATIWSVEDILGVLRGLLLLVGGLTMGWVLPVNFYWGLKMAGEDGHKTSLIGSLMSAKTSLHPVFKSQSLIKIEDT